MGFLDDDIPSKEKAFGREPSGPLGGFHSEPPPLTKEEALQQGFLASSGFDEPNAAARTNPLSPDAPFGQLNSHANTSSSTKKDPNCGRIISHRYLVEQKIGSG